MDLTPARGEIWRVALDQGVGWKLRKSLEQHLEAHGIDRGARLDTETCKTRPCVVVSVNVLNERRRTVIVVPLSSSPKASPPILVTVTCDGAPCVAVTDQIRAVSKERLHSKVGVVSWLEMEALDKALRRIMELG